MSKESGKQVSWYDKPITLKGIGEAFVGATGALLGREFGQTMVTNSVAQAGSKAQSYLELSEFMYKGDLSAHWATNPIKLTTTSPVELAVREASAGGYAGLDGSSLSEQCTQVVDEAWKTFTVEYPNQSFRIGSPDLHEPFSKLPSDLANVAEKMNEVCQPHGLMEEHRILDNLSNLEVAARQLPESGLSAFVKNIEAMIDHPETIPEKLWEVAGLLACVVGVDTLISLGSMFAGHRNIWTNKWENLDNKQKIARGAMDALVVAVTAAVLIN